MILGDVGFQVTKYILASVSYSSGELEVWQMVREYHITEYHTDISLQADDPTRISLLPPAQRVK